ncbi:protein of unknown function DUF77 domain containing protein [Amanita muscaria]
MAAGAKAFCSVSPSSLHPCPTRLTTSTLSQVLVSQQPHKPSFDTSSDFCLIPIGTHDPSVAEYIAECHRVLQKSGLTFKVPNLLYQYSGYGTNIEGPWSKVCQAIHDCHGAVHSKGAPRVATDVRIGTRVDREIAAGEGNEHKLKRVEEILTKGAPS